MQAIRKRETDEVVQEYINAIHELAEQQGISDPLISSTDAFMTSICFIGSKSLSHVLSCIERCKERLLDIGRQSESARKQIITSVMDYWHDQPGVGVNIVDKLLNYTILTPISVIEWVLLEHNDGGAALSRAWIYEMVLMTVSKVSNRVRQVLATRLEPGLPAEQVDVLEETLQTERAEQARLFSVIEDALVAFAEGNKDEMIEAGDDDGSGTRERLIRDWGVRWLRVFRRKAAAEEAFVANEMAAAAAAAEAGENGGQVQAGEDEEVKMEEDAKNAENGESALEGDDATEL